LDEEECPYNASTSGCAVAFVVFPGINKRISQVMQSMEITFGSDGAASRYDAPALTRKI
jgi:hypothetical protein